MLIAQVLPEPDNTNANLPSLTQKQRIARNIASRRLESKIGLLNLLMVFFVTLGPLKIIPVFVQLTRNADQHLRRQLAFRSTGLSILIIFLVTIIGQNTVRAWRIQLPALLLTGGILLVLVSLQIIMAQYTPNIEPKTYEEPSLKLLVKPLIFPTILPPFGIAIALIIMTLSQQWGLNSVIILGLLLLVMAINLVAMLTAQLILAFLKPITLLILGFTLGVMQLALGIELIISGIEIEVLVLQQLLK